MEKGKHHTQETKDKMSKSQLGKKLSEKHRYNLSKAKIGINKGKHLSPNTEIKKGQHISSKTEYKKGTIPWNKDIKIDRNKYKKMGHFSKHSDKTKEIFSKIHKGQKAWNIGLKGYKNKGTFTVERRKEIIVPKKDTSIEVKIQNYLKELNIEFLTHRYMNIEHGYQCDILIPSINLVIECFGDYWHNYPNGNSVDITRGIELRKAGYKVLVFWEREIRAMQLSDLKNKLGEMSI
jgi:G:T-mismatch repair DNA endonuclease (very short patch repair protein)